MHVRSAGSIVLLPNGGFDLILKPLETHYLKRRFYNIFKYKM